MGETWTKRQQQQQTRKLLPQLGAAAALPPQPQQGRRVWLVGWKAWGHSREGRCLSSSWMRMKLPNDQVCLLAFLVRVVKEGTDGCFCRWCAGVCMRFGPGSEERSALDDGTEGVPVGVEGLGAQQGGEVPFFSMDAYEAPERPGVFASCCLFVFVFNPCEDDDERGWKPASVCAVPLLA
jgi:hypothetical protein